MLQKGVFNSMTIESACLAGRNNIEKWMSYEVIVMIFIAKKLIKLPSLLMMTQFWNLYVNMCILNAFVGKIEFVMDADCLHVKLSMTIMWRFSDIFALSPIPWLFPDSSAILWLFQVSQVGGQPVYNVLKKYNINR